MCVFNSFLPKFGFSRVKIGSRSVTIYPIIPHKAMLGTMATGCILAKSEKGRGRKIIFPHRVGSVTFFGETRDTILSTGEEIRSPLWSSRSCQKCLVLSTFSSDFVTLGSKIIYLYLAKKI